MPGAPHPQNFQKAFEDAMGGDKDEVFDKYFRPNMTDPGRTQPYNYSIRFMFQELKDLFTKPEEERKKVLLSEVAPEVREGIGFKVKGVNDWLGKTDANGRGLIDSTHVKAFLCDGANCNAPQASTRYFFANAGDDAAGGGYFDADGSAGGPGNQTAWTATNASAMRSAR